MLPWFINLMSVVSELIYPNAPQSKAKDPLSPPIPLCESQFHQTNGFKCSIVVTHVTHSSHHYFFLQFVGCIMIMFVDCGSIFWSPLQIAEVYHDLVCRSLDLIMLTLASLWSHCNHMHRLWVFIAAAFHDLEVHYDCSLWASWNLLPLQLTSCVLLCICTWDIWLNIAVTYKTLWHHHGCFCELQEIEQSRCLG